MMIQLTQNHETHSLKRRFIYYFSILHGTIPEDLIAIHADPNRVRFPETMRENSVNLEYALDIDVMPRNVQPPPRPELNEQERNEAAF